MHSTSSLRIDLDNGLSVLGSESRHNLIVDPNDRFQIVCVSGASS
jgi:hypothetical protein